MTTIVTRAGKGSPLTNTEMDTNLTNLNTDKLEVATAASTYQPLDSDLTAIAALATNGYARRTGVGTWVIDTTIAGSYITGAINSVTLGLTTPAAGRVTTLLVNQSGFVSTEVLRVGGDVSITGRLGVAANFNAAYLAYIGGGLGHPDTASTIYGLVSDYTGLATATNAASGFTSTLRSAASAYTVSSLLHFDANLTAKGAGSTITSVFGFRANSSIATGTNNYGFYSNIASAATTWQLYMAGTAGNYLASNLRIGTTTLVASEALRVAGTTNLDTLIVNTGCAINPSGTGSMDNVGIGQTTRLGGHFSGVAIGSTGVVAGNISAYITIPSTPAAITLLANIDATTTSANTTGLYGFSTLLNTANSAFTITDIRHFTAWGTTKGAASTITNVTGFRADSAIAVGTNNYGFVSTIAAASTNYGLYFSGTAQNYFAGNVGFAAVTPLYPIDVTAAASYVGINIRGDSVGSLGGILFTDNAGTTTYGRILGGSSGYISFHTGSPLAPQMQIVPVATAVNSLALSGAVAGQAPLITTLGPAGDIGLRLASKGTGFLTVFSHSGAQTQFRVRGDNLAVNFIDVFGVTAGAGPIIRAEGSDPNIRLNLYSKGTDAVIIGTNQGASVTATFVHVATAVNYLWFAGNATGLAPQIRAEGVNTDISLHVSSKGIGAVNFYTGAATHLQVSVVNVTSADRYITLAGSNSGNPTIGVSGGSLAISAAVIGAGTIACTAGTGTGQPILIGTLSVNTTQVGNVGAGADNLMTYSLPANSLSANGKGVRITAWGRLANNANAKTLNLSFGGTAITIPTRVSVDYAWRITCIVIRTGASTQRVTAEIQGSTVNATTTPDAGVAEYTPGENDTAAITIKCVGTGVANDDVMQRGMIVEFLS